MIDVTFDSMGSQVRLIIGQRADRSTAPADEAIDRAREWLAAFEATLSRFNPASELCALNRDPRTDVPASKLMQTAVNAGIWAAEHSGGLVDPTLIGEIEHAGYSHSLAGSPPAADRTAPATGPIALADALATAPPCRPASARSDQRWRAIRVDAAVQVVRRPPGLRIDSGGFGKGLAADALAHRLRGYRDLIVDCGGDIRVATRPPHAIEVEHPLTGGPACVLRVASGAVATSGLGRRLWRNGDGTIAHHLLDPSTGQPAWTGVLQATALAPTVLEAETLAKAALLSGPGEAARILARHGGAVVTDDGSVERVAPPASRDEVAA